MVNRRAAAYFGRRTAGRKTSDAGRADVFLQQQGRLDRTPCCAARDDDLFTGHIADGGVSGWGVLLVQA